MKKTLRLLKEYNEATSDGFAGIAIYDNESGAVIDRDSEDIFYFDSLKELHKKLKKATKKVLR